MGRGQRFGEKFLVGSGIFIKLEYARPLWGPTTYNHGDSIHRYIYIVKLSFWVSFTNFYPLGVLEYFDAKKGGVFENFDAKKGGGLQKFKREFCQSVKVKK